MSKEPKKGEKGVAVLVGRLAATFLVIWVCTQMYILSVTGQEGQGKKNDGIADPQIEQVLIKDMSDALTANAVTGVNGAAVLEARKALLDYYLRTNNTVNAEIEGRHWRDEAMKDSSISFEEKIAALSEVAAAMRDIGRFILAEEIHTQLLKELSVRVQADGGSDAERIKLASQLNNLGVTYFMWSQTIVDPKVRKEKFALAMKQNALCRETLLKSKTTDRNRLEKENLLSTIESNRQIYETEISFGGP